MSLASVEANARVGGPKMSNGLSLSGDMVIRRAWTALRDFGAESKEVRDGDNP